MYVMVTRTVMEEKMKVLQFVKLEVDNVILKFCSAMGRKIARTETTKQDVIGMWDFRGMPLLGHVLELFCFACVSL